MFDALGVGGGGSLIGGVAILLAPIPFIFYRYGEKIRKRSKFAPTPDKDSNVEQEVPRRQGTSTSSIIESSISSTSENGSNAGLDHVEKPDSPRASDVGQTTGGGSSEKDLDKDLEKGDA
jgi:DHA1 family multidrug resistance protein-like MFS transporter